MKKILSVFIISGLGVGNVCFGDDPLSSANINRINVQQYTPTRSIKANSKVESNIRSTRRTLTIMGAALIGGGIAAYYYIPDLLKLVSRYFEGTSRLVNAGQKVVENIGNSDVIKAKGTSRLVNAGQKVAENIGNSDVIKATGWTKVIDVAKKYGPYAAVISVVSLVSLVRAGIEIKQREEELNNAQNKIEQFQEKSTNTQDVVEQLQKKLTKAQNEIEQLQEKLINAQNEIEQLQEKLTNTQDEVEELQDKPTNAQDEVEQLQEELINAQNEITQLQEKLTQAQNDEITQLQKGLNEAKQALEQFKQDQQGCKKEIKQLQEGLKTVQDEEIEENLKADIMERQIKLTNNKNALKRLGEKLKYAKNEKKSIQNKITQLQEELTDAQIALEQVKKNQLKVQENITGLSQKLEAEKNEKAERNWERVIDNSLIGAKQAFGKFKTELRDVKNKEKDIQDKIEQLQKKLIDAQNEPGQDEKQKNLKKEIEIINAVLSEVFFTSEKGNTQRLSELKDFESLVHSKNGMFTFISANDIDTNKEKKVDDLISKARPIISALKAESEIEQIYQDKDGKWDKQKIADFLSYVYYLSNQIPTDIERFWLNVHKINEHYAKFAEEGNSTLREEVKDYLGKSITSRFNDDVVGFYYQGSMLAKKCFNTKKENEKLTVSEFAKLYQKVKKRYGNWKKLADESEDLLIKYIVEANKVGITIDIANLFNQDRVLDNMFLIRYNKNYGKNGEFAQKIEDFSAENFREMLKKIVGNKDGRGTEHRKIMEACAQKVIGLDRVESEEEKVMKARKYAVKCLQSCENNEEKCWRSVSEEKDGLLYDDQKIKAFLEKDVQGVYEDLKEKYLKQLTNSIYDSLLALSFGSDVSNLWAETNWLNKLVSRMKH